MFLGFGIGIVRMIQNDDDTISDGDNCRQNESWKGFIITSDPRNACLGVDGVNRRNSLLLGILDT